MMKHSPENSRGGPRAKARRVYRPYLGFRIINSSLIEKCLFWHIPPLFMSPPRWTRWFAILSQAIGPISRGAVRTSWINLNCISSPDLMLKENVRMFRTACSTKKWDRMGSSTIVRKWLSRPNPNRLWHCCQQPIACAYCNKKRFRLVTDQKLWSRPEA